MKKIAFLSILLIAVFAGCKKDNLAGNEVTGEGLVDFALKTPSSGTNLVLNAALPNQTVDITWNPAKPGLSTLPTYTWVAVKKGSTFETPLVSIPSNNNGKDAKLTVTFKKLDDALKAKGVADGAKIDLVWAVMANNGSTKIMSQNTFNLSVTRFSDGATPFILLAPVSSDASVTINPTSTSDKFVFRWTKSLPKAGGSPIVYKVLFSATSNFETPLFTLKADAAPADTMRTISYKAISDSLSAHGFSNESAVDTLKWTVVATSGTWKQQADYVNSIAILREVNLFIVGGATPIGWNPTSALQFIQDRSRTGVYFMYTYLTTGNGGFKFLSLKADWSAPGQRIRGEANASNTSGNVPSNNTGNLAVAANGENIATPNGDGVYRITVDLINNKYYVQSGNGRMGFVGSGTAAGWNPPNVFPSQKLGYAETNLFVGIANVTTGGEYKLIDNNDWPNGNVDYTRDYEDGGNGVLKEDGGPNFMWSQPTGPVRFIWDWRDVKNPKYIANAATEMRLVGNGMNVAGVNDWDPPTSPQMTYMGNGVWTITVVLKADKEIKFLAGNAWGAFDYEDNSGQVNTIGTARKIKWDGSDNFKTPATPGTYTITLDEGSQTVTIN